MKVFAILIFEKIIHVENTLGSNNVKLISEAMDVSMFGYFQRKFVQESFRFISEEFIKGLNHDSLQTLAHDNYLLHVKILKQKITPVIITDLEYPSKTAFKLISMLINNYNGDDTLLNESLVKYQNPLEVDDVYAIQQDLSETMDIMKNSIEKVLERSEKLELLIDRSTHLSSQSKIFYKQAKKMNSCCVIL